MPLNWNAQSLAAATAGRWKGELCAGIEGFSIDTRSLKGGAVFIALKTNQRDGHGFLKQAMDKGAVAAIVSKYQADCKLPQLLVDDTFAALNRAAEWQRQRFAGKLIAVTGSSGKTGTKDLLQLMLGRDRCHATEGNFNNHIGVPLSLLNTAQDHWQYSVLEIGMNQPGEIAALTQLVKPDCCVVTSVGPAHLEGVGDLAAVAREKVAICQYAGEHADRFIAGSCCSYEVFRSLAGKVTVVCNNDDLPFEFSLPNNYNQLTYTTTDDPEAGLLMFMGDSRASGHFISFAAVSPGVCANAALALTVAGAEGVDMQILQQRLNEWRPGHLRGERIREAGRQWYVDCYNANPASMIDALLGFDRTYNSGRRLFVIGGMRELGLDSQKWHRRVGASIPARPDDELVLIGREAEWILQGLLAAGIQPGKVSVLDDPLAARAITDDFQGSIFLKGSRAYQLERLLPAIERGQAC